MILSAVYVLVVAQSSSEAPEGLMNNPVLKMSRNAEHVLRFNCEGCGKDVLREFIYRNYVNTQQATEP